MKKLIIFFLALLLFCGCESRLDKAIPQSSLVGAVSNIDVNLEGRGELKDQKGCTNKAGWCWEPKDWTLLMADAFVPFDIKKEQIKPTLLAIFKRLKNEYPKCTIINIWLEPDKELAEILYPIGSLEYHDNKMVINYGIPSDKEMEEHNSQIGKFEIIKNILPMPGEKEEKIEKNEEPRLFRPDQKTYEFYKRILITAEDIKFSERKDTRKRKLFNSTKEYYADLSNKVSKKIDVPIKDIENALRFMNSYYSWFGEEKFDFIL
ncbi:MAG: hypothetical protein ABSF79_04910 [Smithellaceae bacterium]|jgi:hypothetical protein